MFYDDIFKNKVPLRDKFPVFGFCLENGVYVYSCGIVENQFTLTVRVMPDGKVESKVTDPDTGDEYVLPWLEVVKSIHPELVTIYTLDRETPSKSLLKATHEELDRIADLIHAAGLKCTVSY